MKVINKIENLEFGGPGFSTGINDYMTISGIKL